MLIFKFWDFWVTAIFIVIWLLFKPDKKKLDTKIYQNYQEINVNRKILQHKCSQPLCPIDFLNCY